MSDTFFTLDFNEAKGEPYRAFYEPYLMSIVSRRSNETGVISSLRCISEFNHKTGDKHPSAFVDLRTGVYGCSVCGNFSPYRFLTDIIGLSRFQASGEVSTYRNDATLFPKFDNFAKGYGFALDKLTEFNAKCQDRITKDLTIVQDYLESRGLHYQTLIDAGVGYAPKSDGQVECLTFPYFLNGKVVAVRGRTKDGRKGGVKGSRYVPFNLDNAIYPTIVLCEGESDTLRVEQALRTLDVEVSAVGIPGANFKREFDREFSGVKNVYILPQADEASYKFTQQVQQILGANRVEVIKLPWRRGEPGKDACDWLLNHEDEELIDLLPVKRERKVFFTHSEFIEHSKKDIPWLIPGLIARGDKVLIGGEQKSMKSFLALFMVKAMTTGTCLFEYEDWRVENPLKVLFVEEEGSSIAFAKRVSNIIGELDNDNVLWAYKPTLKLDTGDNMKDLYEKLEEYAPDVLILDPLQRMMTVDEDSSTEMATVWHTIHNFTVKYPNMAVIVIHHYRKGGASQNSFDSIRGSSRTAGELDEFIGVSKKPKRTDLGEIVLSVRIEGRDIPPVMNDEANPGVIEILIDTSSWKATVKKSLEISLVEAAESESNIDKIRRLLTGDVAFSITQISELLDLNRHIVHDCLTELAEKKEVIKQRGELPNKKIGFLWRLIQ